MHFDFLLFISPFVFCTHLVLIGVLSIIVLKISVHSKNKRGSSYADSKSNGMHIILCICTQLQYSSITRLSSSSE